jgi:hypothetical protein
VARARTANGRQIKGVRAREAKLLDAFVTTVSRLPFVEQVLAVPGYEGVEIWTVIDAEPWVDGPNDQVYQAELDAWDAVPGALILHRLINHREYGDEKLSQVLPDDRYLAWRRSSQS